MIDVDVVHIVCSIIATYNINKLLNYFLMSEAKNKKLEVISFTAYYILLILTYFKIRIPLIMLIFNLTSFLILTLNYKADIKRRLLAVVYVYSILFIIEMLAAAVTGYIYVPFNSVSNYSNVFGAFVNQLLVIVVRRIIICRKKFSSKISMPFIYWISIIEIPIFSLYFLVLIFDHASLNKINIILSVSFLLFINFSVMVLYDMTVSSVTEKTKSMLLEQQNKFYLQQMGLLQTSIKNNNRLQHDMKGHLLTIKAFLKESSINEASNYIDKMLNIDTRQKEENIYNSGNPIIDSILNWKSQEAKANNITVNIKLKIPEQLDIDHFDITIVLGNIIDNAMDAAIKVEDNKKINILIVYDRRRLVLKVENTYNSLIILNNRNILTSKKNKFVHGIGLQNVKSVVEKYDGTMDIDYDKSWFKIYLMLYI